MGRHFVRIFKDTMPRGQDLWPIITTHWHSHHYVSNNTGSRCRFNPSRGTACHYLILNRLTSGPSRPLQPSLGPFCPNRKRKNQKTKGVKTEENVMKTFIILLHSICLILRWCPATWFPAFIFTWRSHITQSSPYCFSVHCISHTFIKGTPDRRQRSYVGRQIPNIIEVLIN